MADHFLGENWYLLSQVGCDHPCVSFVFSCGYLGLFYFWWCAYVYMCVLLVVWVRFSFEILVSFIYFCVLFRVFVYHYVLHFCIFVLLAWSFFDSQ